MDEIKKENYEIAFWVREENDESIKKLLAKHGAQITREKPIQKMRLAFPIKKENYAFLGTIIFSVPTGAIAGVKTDLNLEAEILRYFLRRAKKVTAEEKPALGSEAAASKERKPFFRLRSDVKKEEVLTNEALEKKIEEILQ